MSMMEMYDDPVEVTALMTGHNQLRPQELVWRGQSYALVSVGRQWDEDEGRFILTEAADGARFELQLRREDFTWRLRKVWPPMLMA